MLSAFSICLPVLDPTYKWNNIFDFLMPGLFSNIVFVCILYKNFTFWIMDNKEWMDDNTNCSGCISLIWNAWTFQLKSVPAFQFFGLWNICICTMRYLEHWTLVKYTKFIYFGYTLYIENKDKSGVFIMPVFWLQPVAWVQGWNFPFIVTWLYTVFRFWNSVCTGWFCCQLDTN